MVRDAGPATLSASHERARRLDEAQYASGRGPCLAAAMEWAMSNVVVADAAARWPEFAQAAVADAILSVLPVPSPGEETPRTTPPPNGSTGSQTAER